MGVSLALAVAPWLAVPPHALAAGSCSYDGVNTVNVSIGDGQTGTLSAPSGRISLDGNQCTDGTVDNTTSIQVQGSSGHNGLVVDLQPGPFTSSGNADVPITVDLAGGGDSLDVSGTGGPDTITAGANGISLNSAANLDVVLNSGVALSIDGTGGDDVISGAGGSGTGGAYGGAISITGGPGDDTLTGGSGDDTFFGGDGNDAFDGGPGTDTVDFSGAPNAITANLGTGIATGAGSDTLNSIETLIGSSFADHLTGGSGTDTLNGGPGNDTLLSGPGDDTMNGGGGNDTASFANANGGVTVSLAAGTASGDGSDTLGASIDTVIGSSHADHLIGGPGPDTLNGGPASDTLTSGHGSDTMIGGGGGGNDTADYTNANGPVTASLGIRHRLRRRRRLVQRHRRPAGLVLRRPPHGRDPPPTRSTAPVATTPSPAATATTP